MTLDRIMIADLVARTLYMCSYNSACRLIGTDGGDWNNSVAFTSCDDALLICQRDNKLP